MKPYLAGLVFHELAHQRVYVTDDSAFNEAFAVAVETTGVRKWLRASGDAAGLRRYEADRKRRAEFLAILSQTRDELGHVYDGAGTSEHKRAAKKAAIERLRLRYRGCATGAGADTGDTMPGSTRRSTTRSSPRLPFTAMTWRRFCACSTCVRATIPASTRRLNGSARSTNPTGRKRSRPRIHVMGPAGLKTRDDRQAL